MKGENIELRTINIEDLELLNKWKNDESIYRYLGGGFVPTSLYTHEKYMDKIMDTSGKDMRFIIIVNNIRIGFLGIYNINTLHRTCEIGIFIGEKDYLKKGFASESIEVIEKYIKNYLNLRKIKINVVEENSKAYDMWKKHGYIQVGKLIEERFICGEYKDLIIMEKFI